MLREFETREKRKLLHN